MKGYNEDFESFTLPNGIRCVHRRNPTSPVAHIALTVGAGTRDEAGDHHGVAHLAEHLIFKGTERRNAWQVNSLLENAGGELNAFTTKEETVVHATLLRSEFTKGVDLLADMVFHSTFDEREIGKEKEVILDEINSYRDSPAELIYDEFEALLFAGSGLGRNILGDRQGLRRVRRPQVVGFVGEHYRADQTVFSASSPLTHRRFREVCERYLGVVPTRSEGGGEEQKGRTAPGRIKKRFEVTKKPNTHQGHCLLGGYAYSLHQAERVPFAFLINYLGGPASVSRLNLELRERRGLTYHVEASYVPYSDAGMWTIYLGCDKEKTERSLELVYKELRMLQEAPLTDLQLARAKRLFLGQLALANESSEALMLAVAKSLLVYGSFDRVAEIAARVAAISAAELQEVARTAFAPDNLNLLIYK